MIAKLKSVEGREEFSLEMCVLHFHINKFRTFHILVSYIHILQKMTIWNLQLETMWK